VLLLNLCYLLGTFLIKSFDKKHNLKIKVKMIKIPGGYNAG